MCQEIWGCLLVCCSLVCTYTLYYYYRAQWVIKPPFFCKPLAQWNKIINLISPVVQFKLSWVINGWCYWFGSVVCVHLFWFSLNKHCASQLSEPVLLPVSTKIRIFGFQCHNTLITHLTSNHFNHTKFSTIFLEKINFWNHSYK